MPFEDNQKNWFSQGSCILHRADDDHNLCENHGNGHHKIDDDQTIRKIIKMVIIKLMITKTHGNYHKIGHHNIDDDQIPWEKS